MPITFLESVAVGAAGVGNRPQLSAEVAWGRRVGRTIPRLPAGGELLRVLVVDDNRDAADSLSLLVEMWGHEVRRAYGGEAALEMAFADRPDVLLLDLAMPKMDGCELARQLRQRASTQDALLIAITGYADQAHRLLCKSAGFDVFLIKPTRPSVVEELLLLRRDWLRSRRKPGRLAGVP